VVLGKREEFSGVARVPTQGTVDDQDAGHDPRILPERRSVEVVGDRMRRILRLRSWRC
jgi:hypothetical protein